MTREIEFRAFEVKSKIMFDWMCIMQTAFNDPRQAKIEGYYGLLYQIMSDPDVRFKKMQYTGLKDKNGREVYEGDRVYFLCDNSICGFSEVRWSEKDAMFTDAAYNPISSLGDIVICGNIHENPDLIKE